MRKSIAATIIFLTGLILIESCKDTEVTPEPFLTASEYVIRAASSYNSQHILIGSNTSWTVTVDSPWLSTSPKSGTGSLNLAITCETSDYRVEREGHVIIQAGSLELRLTVIQAANPNGQSTLKIIGSEGVIGNYINDVRDSVILTFDRPVTVTALKSNYDLCVGEMKYRVYSNHVSFNYDCARLGRSYPFTITVKDGVDVATFDFDVPFYQQKQTVNGYIRDYIVANDNETIWAITESTVIQFSLSDLRVQNQQSLGFSTGSLHWNTFSNTLNVFKTAGPCYFDDIKAGKCDNNLIYVNPDDFSISRSRIELIKGYDADNFGYPYVFPSDLALFEDGTGIIQLQNENNYNGWRFIDSGNHDSTYIADIHRSAPYDIRYQSAYENYNKSEIYMMHPWGSTSIDVYKPGMTKPQTYTSPMPGRSNMLIPNKKRNLVYHGQLYEQFISDMNGYVSKPSYIDTRAFYGGTDFSYKANEEETIYNLADGSFEILDYKTASTLFSTDTDQQLMKIHSTTDGVHLVAIRQNSNATTDVFVFNIDSMSKNRIDSSNSAEKSGVVSADQRKARWKN